VKKGRIGAGVEYTTISEVRGPLIIVDHVTTAAYDELVEVEAPDGEVRLGRVLEVGEGRAVVQVFEGTSGLSVEGVRARFLGETMRLGVSEELLGRVFDGLGRPIDGLPAPPAEDYRDVNGEPINPERREYPSDFIQTGISAIDVMNSLVMGQKLPIFSGPGLTHNILAAQIARQATVPGREEEFAVVFAALGAQNDEARYFRRSLEESGAIGRSALFLNLADDPAVERIITPRVALTFAEYLAFDKDYHVLVIITDMTNYCFSGDTEVILANGDILRIGKLVEDLNNTAEAPSYVLQSPAGYALIQKSRLYKVSSTAYALSWKDGKTVNRRIVAVERIGAPKRLMYIRTRSGATLKITHDQKLLVDTDEGPCMLSAAMITLGQELYSLEKIDVPASEPYILLLLAEKSPERFYAYMRDASLEESLALKFGSLAEACRKLGISHQRPSDKRYKRLYRLDELLRAAEAVGIGMEELTSKISYITTDGKERVRIREPRVTEGLTRALGWVLSDGGIYESDEQGVYYVSFSNKSRELVELFAAEVQRVFGGTNPQICRNSSGTWTARFNSLVISQVFSNLAKISEEGELLRVFKLPINHVTAFISGYFDGGGSVILKNKRALVLTTRSERRARRLQLILKRLGVQSVLRRRTSRINDISTEVMDIVVRGASLKRLASLLTPYHPSKRKALKELANKVNEKTEKFYLAPRIASRLLKSLRKRYGIRQKELGPSSTVSRLESGLRRISRKGLKELLTRISALISQSDAEYQQLKSLAEDNYILDEVVEVNEVVCEDSHVYDMTINETHTLIVANGIIASNCEALREISAAREEVPGRKGYPGYMYSDLASIYERAGRIKGKKGTITQMPILTMPSDDITHPVPDLTGYITEGQIVLSRDLHRKGIYPPINVLMSLSRLMGPGVIAPRRTRPDHGDVSNQLYASYSRAVQLRSLAEIVGKSSLSPQDIKLIEFGDLFETRLLKQGADENRSLDDSLEIAWEILSSLPEDSLTKIRPEFIKKYYRRGE